MYRRRHSVVMFPNSLAIKSTLFRNSRVYLDSKSLTLIASHDDYSRDCQDTLGALGLQVSIKHLKYWSQLCDVVTGVVKLFLCLIHFTKLHRKINSTDNKIARSFELGLTFFFVIECLIVLCSKETNTTLFTIQLQSRTILCRTSMIWLVATHSRPLKTQALNRLNEKKFWEMMSHGDISQL